jgi:hypothetical protein
MAALISSSNRTDNDNNNNKGFIVRIALFVCVILPSKLLRKFDSEELLQLLGLGIRYNNLTRYEIGI